MTLNTMQIIQVRKDGQMGRILSAIVLVGFISYVMCYVYGGDVGYGTAAKVRFYKSGVIARIFVPAAWVESHATRKIITVGGVDRYGDGPYDFRTFYYTAIP